MTMYRDLARLSAATLLAVVAMGCTAPSREPGPGVGAIVGTRVIDVMGDLTIQRGSTEAALEGPAAARTICDCAGIEYTVRLDSGSMLTIAQELRSRPLQVGQRIIVQDRNQEKLVMAAPGS